MRQVVKQFQLDENYSIEMVRNEYETDFWKVDNKLKHKWYLATLSENKKWNVDNIEWWKLIKKYPNIIKNNIFKPLPFSNEITVEKQFTCFKRRINISILRTLNKLKYK